MGAHADRLNRVVLTLLGLLLLSLGVLGLLPALGVLGERSDDLVLPRDVEDFVTNNAGWLWPLVALLLVLLALIALRWLVQQLRTDRVGDLDLTRDRANGETHLRASAVTDALTTAVEQMPGVESAAARVIRRHGSRVLLLKVRLADRADAAQVRRALAHGPLAELRTVLGGLSWPDVRVELEPTSKGSARAVA
ncbi:MAG: alkaline shock response membrane anchor protein AmaP [Frankiaceae bacterium]|nr:alkaline shock response membrane anchor protein AmaP [Frankiaceae bacterium]